MSPTSTQDRTASTAPAAAEHITYSPTPTITERERKGRIEFAHTMAQTLGKSSAAAKVAAKYEVSETEAERYVAEGRAEAERRALLERWGVFQVPEDAKSRKFYPGQLAKLIDAETPVATAPDGSLYSYAGGVYLPDAEPKIRRRIKALLTDDWSTRAVTETVASLESSRGLIPDASADRINCTNGVYNRRTGKLEPHSPDDLTPVQIGAAYDPDATCPAIEKFVADVLPDPADQRLFYELAGYLLIPDNTLQAAFMFIGAGANGKSTALKLPEALLGRRNVSHVSLQALGEDRFAAAALHGKLANIYGDLDRAALASTSTFKNFTGGEDIEAQRKFKPPFTFTPYARFLFSANEAPPSPDGSDGYFRRWVVIPFRQRFEGTDRDPLILAKLTTAAELSGLLNKALDALPALLERGRFEDTDATRAAAEEFRRDTDSVAGFLVEETELDPDARADRAALYRAYKHWCEQSGRGGLSAQKFNGRIRAGQHAVSEVTVEGRKHWAGLRWAGAESAGADHS